LSTTLKRKIVIELKTNYRKMRGKTCIIMVAQRYSRWWMGPNSF